MWRVMNTGKYLEGSRCYRNFSSCSNSSCSLEKRLFIMFLTYSFEQWTGLTKYNDWFIENIFCITLAVVAEFSAGGFRLRYDPRAFLSSVVQRSQRLDIIGVHWKPVDVCRNWKDYLCHCGLWGDPLLKRKVDSGAQLNWEKTPTGLLR